MPSQINRTDPLNEQAPNGTVLPAVPHVVHAVAKATQTLLKINGEPVLREGDTFNCGYSPQAGVKFVRILSSMQGAGKIKKNGKSFAKLLGKKVITLGDSNTTECDGVQEQSNRLTVNVNLRNQILRIHGCVALTGK